MRSKIYKFTGIACLFLCSELSYGQMVLKKTTNTIAAGYSTVDVNDSGKAVTPAYYFDFETGVATPRESGTAGLASINNNGDVAGSIIIDADNGINHPAYKLNGGTWTDIGWFPGFPDTNGFTTYKISENGKYVVGQMSKSGSIAVPFFYSIENQSLTDLLPAGSQWVNGAAYSVNDNKTIAGWVDQPNPGTLRIPMYTNSSDVITFVTQTLPTASVNAVNGINANGVMAGDYNSKPFIYDPATDTFTSFNNPTAETGWVQSSFTDIADDGTAIGWAYWSTGTIFTGQVQYREAIIYNPALGPQPLLLKDVLANHNITITDYFTDGHLGTGMAISPNGQYIGGYNNAAYIFATGWVLFLNNELLGTKENVSKAEISVYPNPVRDVMHISIPDAKGKVNLTFYDTSGKLLYTESQNASQNVEIHSDKFAKVKGVYFVKIETGGREIYKKLIVD